jgi:hypothetical protein
VIHTASCSTTAGTTGVNQLISPELLSQFKGFKELEWLYLQGCPGLLPGHRAALLAALPWLEGVDDLPRPPPAGAAADVWINPGVRVGGWVSVHTPAHNAMQCRWTLCRHVPVSPPHT